MEHLRAGGRHSFLTFARVNGKKNLLPSSPSLISLDSDLYKKCISGPGFPELFTAGNAGLSNSISLRAPSSLSAGGVAPFLTRSEAENPQMLNVN
jgi:hypothetical protein